ncbi:MAG: hypothetical protein LBI65_00700 [Candidatus Symbiothrix sp.]|jgi:hypothetical protein|nr:hypothetical protein [Candidatus Symbiothrix sp.]
MNKSCGLFLFFSLFLASFFACNDDFENYSDSPHDLLSFSVDTLRFDTVLSAVNTPFYAFRVYNKNSKPLLISSINLKNAGTSGFKINVDGQAGAHFNNVEIRANDSLYVLVDIKPDKTGKNQPVIINDYIEFITNGQQQGVVLEAYGQDVVVWRGLTLSSGSVLSNLKPFLIYDSLVIDEGIVVDVKEGTVFYMHKNAEIIVKGTLRINGSAEKPVTIRGDRTDFMVGVPYDLIPGQWGGIRFTSTSFDNVFEYARIRNGNFGINMELSDPSRSKLKMNNVILTNFKGALIRSANCRLSAENCEFSNSRNALLSLTGGNSSFTHCTLANYYASNLEAGWGNSKNETVILSSTYYHENDTGRVNPEYYPVLQADFYNTIVWGMQNRTTSQIAIEENDSSFISYYFENCVIPNESATNDDVNNPDIVPRVVNCLINKYPEFLDISPAKRREDDTEFTYDFRLDSISPARNIANPKYARRLPIDINGISRLSDEGPDIGGYEYELRIKN